MKKTKCEYCDAGNELIRPFWDSPYHYVKDGEPNQYVSGYIRIECANLAYDEGCPGCGGPRGHYGECK